MPGRQAWGDDDDDDYLPPRQESAVDSKGVKSIVEYHFNTNGAKVTHAWIVEYFFVFILFCFDTSIFRVRYCMWQHTRTSMILP